MSVKNQKTSIPNSLIISASGILAIYFFYNLLIILQNVRVADSLGSPSAYTAAPSAIMATYILYVSKNNSHKYLSVIILTVLVVGIVVWLFGATSVGAGLATMQIR